MYFLKVIIGQDTLHLEHNTTDWVNLCPTLIYIIFLLAGQNVEDISTPLMKIWLS